MAMNTRRNPLSALLDYATARGDEASSIGSVMSQLAGPILKGQGVNVEDAVQRGPVPQLTLANTAPVPPLPKTTSDAQEYYIREFQKRGMSRPASEGIVAGMGSESGLNPAINERNPTVPGSRGGFGLYQLTGPRRIAFERWASENGKNVNDDQAQIDFMMTEFAGPERKAYDALIQSPDAQSAATVFTDQFLRPGVSHTTQSANEAARMSGQPYDPSIAGSGAMAATGGALPQTVEGILSSLYPNAAEDEKAAHRKDIWRGLSQGLSALSQGGQVDLSNIAANADTRRRQYVLDTREKEKAKAAASLVYSQTGDASMAAGIASGAINYTDVLNERQMKRAEQTAQDARLKDAATTDALVSAMKAGKMPQETIDLVQKGGVDALSAYQKIQADQSLLEQEAKQQDVRDQNVADARFILSTAGAGSPQARAAERVIALNGEEDVYTLLKDRTPTGADATANMQDADALVASKAINPQTQQPFTKAEAIAALTLPAPAAGAAPTNEMQNADALVASGAINPDTNEPFTPAEATAVLTLPAPAGSEQSNAQNEAQDLFASKATNPDTQQPFTSYGEALAWRLGSGGPDTKVEVYTGSTGQEVAPSLVAAEEKLAAKGQMFARVTNPKTGQLEIVMNADGSPKIINIEGGEAETAANADTAAKQADAEKATMRAVRQTLSADTILRYGKDVLDKTADWEAGVGQGLATMAAGLIPQTVTSEVQNRVSTIKSLTSLDNLTAMRLASPTGGALGSVSDAEGSKLESQFGALDVKGDPAVLREDTRAAMNSYLDTVHGTPESILQLYKDGKISAEDADAFSARYVIRGSGVDPEQERIGTTSNLGLSGVRTTVLGDLTDQDIAPTAIKELGVGFEAIIQDDTFFDEGGAFDTLSPTAQAEVKRLMGVK